jgi:hypothetical protein
VTGTQSIHADPGDDVVEMMMMYRRLATMDPPALRSLAVDLERLSDESAASAALQATPREPCEGTPRRSAGDRRAGRARVGRVRTLNRESR